MSRWIIPIALVFSGCLAGVIFNKILFNKLKKLAARTKRSQNEIIIQSLRGIPAIWFIIAGIYGAVLSLPLNSVISQILQKIITVIFIYSVTIVFARLAVGFFTLYSQRILPSASLLSNLVKLAVFTCGILTCLQSIGIEITPILATLGIGGLAIALAFQETLSNVYSGLYLIISKQVRAGDYVKLETGQEGYVIDITWRNTIIKELPNNMIIVPNTKLASAIFTNYHLPAKEITIQIHIGVSYDSDLEQVEKVTIEVAKEVLQVVAGITEFEPFIRYQKFGDFSIEFTVFICVKEFFDQYLTKHEFIKRLHQRYQQEKIKIPFPSQTVYLKDNSK